MIFFKSIRREYTYLKSMLRVLKTTSPMARNSTKTLRELSEHLSDLYSDRLALISPIESFTYKKWNQRANLFARWFRGENFQKGTIVGLFMPNRPEYMSIWVGISKMGGVTALLNTNLTGQSLANCLNKVQAKAAIVDSRLLSEFETALPFLDPPLKIFIHGSLPEQKAGKTESDPDTLPPFPYVSLLSQLEQYSDTNLLPEERVPLTLNDKCVLIFTSGTTGLPKAANINHYRLQLGMLGFASILGTRASDRLYNCLPMYHSNGGMLGPGVMLTVGGTCVLREKFSGREFWSDIHQNQCTIFIYIGELCRYLLHTPPTPYERNHSIRLCFGNGLRPEIWEGVRDRFNLTRINEFYASTEGNINIFNLDSYPGAVGRIPKFLEHKFPIKIVRFDIETEQLIRTPEGFCIECAPGEIGEALGEIICDPKRPTQRFEGYADKSASEHKIARNVFKLNDQWFRSGDLLKKDSEGYYYFVDRIGDTFRWKGENVATSEVSATLTAFPGVQEANVYGVQLEGKEGRAGMASLMVRDAKAFDLSAFHTYMHDHLPEYACPLFLRFPETLEATGTFKYRKIDLVRQGYNPDHVRDPLYFNDQKAKTFVPLTNELYVALQKDEIRL